MPSPDGDTSSAVRSHKLAHNTTDTWNEVRKLKNKAIMNKSIVRVLNCSYNRTQKECSQNESNNTFYKLVLAVMAEWLRR